MKNISFKRKLVAVRCFFNTIEEIYTLPSDIIIAFLMAIIMLITHFPDISRLEEEILKRIKDNMNLWTWMSRIISTGIYYLIIYYVVV